MQFSACIRLQLSTVMAVLLDTNERDRQRETSDKKLDGGRKGRDARDNHAETISSQDESQNVENGREGRDARDNHAETSATHDEPQNVDDGREKRDQSDDRVETITPTRALKNAQTFLANRRSARDKLADGSIERGRYALRNTPHKSRRNDNKIATKADRLCG
jgi:hypothetical protein